MRSDNEIREKGWPCGCFRTHNGQRQIRVNAPDVLRCEDCGTPRYAKLVDLPAEVLERIRRPQAPLEPARSPAAAVRRAELVEKIRRYRADVAQLLADGESWNASHPDEEPIDVDPGGDLAALLTMYDAMLKNDIQ